MSVAGIAVQLIASKPLSPRDRMDGSRQGALAGSGLTHDEHGLVAGSVLDGDL